MNQASPTLAEWKELYKAAIEFKEIESWKWMDDSQVFGVQNPKTGEIGYCCVVGSLGQMYGLIMYLGTKGLMSYCDIQNGKIAPEDPDSLHMERSLMASFEDRQVLQTPDRQIIKKLGLKFRGRNAWPFFRSYEPGYFPWYLNKEEAQFLTIALQQAKVICLRCRQDPELLTPPRDNLFFVRTPKQNGTKITWEDKWLRPEPIEVARTVLDVRDDKWLDEIKKVAPQRHLILEIDIFYSPAPVQEKRGERPYFPYVFLCVDHASELIVHCELANHTEFREKFLFSLLQKFEIMQARPAEIWVKRQEVYDLLRRVAKKLDIALKKVPKLDVLKEAQIDMMAYFKNRG